MRSLGVPVVVVSGLLLAAVTPTAAAVSAQRADTAATAATRPAMSACDMVTSVGENARHSDYSCTSLPRVPRERWEKRFPGDVFSAVMAGSRIYVTVFINKANAQPRLYALNSATGAVVWGPEPAPSLDLSYANGRLFATNGSPRAYSAETGKVLWADEGADIGEQAVPADGLLWGQNNRGELIGLDQATGKQKVQNQFVNLPGGAGSPGLDGDDAVPAVTSRAVYISTGAESDYRLTTHGKILWSRQFGCPDSPCSGGAGGIAAPVDGQVYDSDGQQLLNAGTGHRVRSYAGSPIVAPRTIYLVTGSKLVARRRSTGRVLWTRRITNVFAPTLPVGTSRAIYYVSGHRVDVRSASTGKSLGHLHEPADVAATGETEYRPLLLVAHGTLVFGYNDTLTVYGN